LNFTGDLRNCSETEIGKMIEEKKKALTSLEKAGEGLKSLLRKDNEHVLDKLISLIAIAYDKNEKQGFVLIIHHKNNEFLR